MIVPFSLRFKASDSLALTASLPWVRISGPDLVLGPDGKPLPGFPIARRTRSGIGDLSLSASYSLPMKEDSRWMIDLSGRVKLPTANKGSAISTGKTDVTLGGEVTYLAGQWAPFIGIDYRIPGKLAGGILQNSIATSVGTTWISGQEAIIASYDFDAAISPYAKDGHALFVAWSHRLKKGPMLTFYASKGLSDGSPAIETGLMATIKLD